MLFALLEGMFQDLFSLQVWQTEQNAISLLLGDGRHLS